MATFFLGEIPEAANGYNCTFFLYSPMIDGVTRKNNRRDFMFTIKKKEGFSSREERVLAFWKKHQVFQQSLELRKDAEIFSFYDGPPFATGLPHYGHILSGTIIDVIPRYQPIEGRIVKRRFGTD